MKTVRFINGVLILDKFLNEEFVAEGFRYSDIDVDEKDYEKKIDLPEILKLD